MSGIKILVTNFCSFSWFQIEDHFRYFFTFLTTGMDKFNPILKELNLPYLGRFWQNFFFHLPNTGLDYFAKKHMIKSYLWQVLHPELQLLLLLL